MDKTYNFIKENLTLIAIVPTIIGGISQVIFLTLISPNLVRFFSISQLISDGLFVLLFLGVAIITALPVYYNLNNSIISENKIFKNYIIKTLIAILLYILIKNSLISIGESYRLVNFHQLYTYLYNFYIIELIILYIINHYFKNLKKSLLMIIFLLNSFIASIYCYYNTNQNYEHVMNFKNLISNMEKKECYSKKPKILYFNDKYIFIEVIQKGNENIIIKQTEDLFE